VDGQTLLAGGDVITAVDGTSIESLEDLRGALDQAGLGGTITLTLLREGEEIEVAVMLDSASSQP
jgi:S1-C subfamily serine protease